MAQKDTAKNGNGGKLGFEADLFKAVDKLRGNMEPSDYKHVALGLIFLKYISDAFEAKHKALQADEAQAAEDKDEYLADNVFWVPKEARWTHLEGLQGLICTVRGQEVMLDSDLAMLYGVQTKVFNQAVNRNLLRFPENFRFQLSKDEFAALMRSQVVTSNERGGRRYLHYAFTEQGVAMLSAVLRSDTAIQTSIHIINAFVAMRRVLAAHGGLLQRMDSLEQRQLAQHISTDKRFKEVFDALEQKSQNPTQGIFFDGQIFDAYAFINDLLQLSKRDQGVSATVPTKTISPALIQDLKKNNAQYPPVQIHVFSGSQDRFLILDSERVYHLGASLKDLGKKWFALAKMDKSGLKVMERVQSWLAANLEGVGV